MQEALYVARELDTKAMDPSYKKPRMFGIPISVKESIEVVVTSKRNSVFGAQITHFSARGTSQHMGIGKVRRSHSKRGLLPSDGAEEGWLAAPPLSIYETRLQERFPSVRRIFRPRASRIPVRIQSTVSVHMTSKYPSLHFTHFH